MRRFKVQDRNFEKPTMYITLHKPPYEDADVISRTKWKLQDCTITEMKFNYEEEE